MDNQKVAKLNIKTLYTKMQYLFILVSLIVDYLSGCALTSLCVKQNGQQHYF